MTTGYWLYSIPNRNSVILQLDRPKIWRDFGAGRELVDIDSHPEKRASLYQDHFPGFEVAFPEPNAQAEEFHRLAVGVVFTVGDGLGSVGRHAPTQADESQDAGAVFVGKDAEQFAVGEVVAQVAEVLFDRFE